jgi:hypothetical protein
MANEIPVLEVAAEVSAVEETSQTLADEVLDIVQDGSFSWPDVLKYFNSCLFELAGEFLIPDLERWEDVYTDPGQNNIALPANYHRNLRFCHSITHNRPIEVLGSAIQVFRWYSVMDRTGPVRQVAIKGRRLYYQRVPDTAEQLRINFYSYPERLRTRNDKPTLLPAQLIDPLLVSYACMKLFNKVEDALEGPKANTEKHKGDYIEAKAYLAAFLGPEERAPQDFPEEINWNVLV